LTMHHIVSDGWSMGLLIDEIGQLYQSFRDGQQSPLEELEIQYGDFAQWQRGWLQGEVLQTELDYWKVQLDGAPALLELPTDWSRPPVQRYLGASQTLEFSEELSNGLLNLCRSQGVTLYMLLLAAFKVLLSRHCGQQDILVGSPIAGRNRIETERLIGFFVNTLVLRTRIDPAAYFTEGLTRVKEVVLDAHAHQDLPFEKLVEELQPERSLSYSPIFQVMFSVNSSTEMSANGSTSDLRMSTQSVIGHTSKFDLNLTLTRDEASISGGFT